MDRHMLFTKTVVEGILLGVVACEVESQPRGEHDFDLVFPNGETGVLELTAAADPTRIALNRAVLDERKGGQTLQASLSEGDWYVTPMPDANISLIRERVDSYLAEIERDGISWFHSELHRWSWQSVEAIFRDLRVAHGSKLHTNRPRSIWIGLAGGGGAIGPSGVNDAVAHAASRPDNLRKLCRPDRDQRHLFVYVDPSHDMAYLPLVLLDEVAPALTVDARITHLWAATHTSRDEAVVWFAQNGESWQVHRLLVPPLFED
jgi:hypothetical protein